MKIAPIRLLLLVNLSLGIGLGAMWLDQTGAVRNNTWSPPTPVVPQIAKLEESTLAPIAPADPLRYLAVLERPLFAPDRRPPPPPPPPPIPDPMASVQVLGLFAGENGGILARIEGRVRRVKVNELMGPWLLKSIEGREATFVQGDEVRKVQLTYSKFGVQAAQPVAASAVPNQSVPAATTVQDEMRARLIRRNEVRARAGLPPALE